jgi:hypothetical protein
MNSNQLSGVALTENERQSLERLDRECGDRWHPWDTLTVSKTKISALTKYGLVDMLRGREDGSTRK